jgi:hypothetical protein
MFFPPPSDADVDIEPEDLHLTVDGIPVELVDEFHYLGFRLDSQMSDSKHVAVVNDRYLRAACVVGKLMRDLRCSNLLTPKKFYMTLVFSQLYGIIFVDTNLIEFERGVGVFFRSALGLPKSYPSVVAMSVLGVKHLSVFVLEQRTKFLLKAERLETTPVFTALVADRCELFPIGVGVNARYGEVLETIGVLRTLDYCEYFQKIQPALCAFVDANHRMRLLDSEGRTFWLETLPTGYLPHDLKQVTGLLMGETARICFLILSSSFFWSLLKTPNQPCTVFCSSFYYRAPFLM